MRKCANQKLYMTYQGSVHFQSGSVEVQSGVLHVQTESVHERTSGVCVDIQQEVSVSYQEVQVQIPKCTCQTGYVNLENVHVPSGSLQVQLEVYLSNTTKTHVQLGRIHVT